MPLPVNERHHQMTFSAHFPLGVCFGNVYKTLEKRERTEEQIWKSALNILQHKAAHSVMKCVI
jgi:hypothetical protein